jgi:hypothetical protein
MMRWKSHSLIDFRMLVVLEWNATFEKAPKRGSQRMTSAVEFGEGMQVGNFVGAIFADFDLIFQKQRRRRREKSLIRKKVFGVRELLKLSQSNCGN